MKFYGLQPPGDYSAGATQLGSCLHDPLAIISEQLNKFISDAFAYLRGFANGLPAASSAILLFAVAILVWLIDDRFQFRLLATHREATPHIAADFRVETVDLGRTEFEAMDLLRMSPPSKNLSQGDAVHMSDASKCFHESGNTDCTCAGQPSTCEKEHAERVYKVCCLNAPRECRRVSKIIRNLSDILIRQTQVAAHPYWSSCDIAFLVSWEESTAFVSIQD